jgi:hypothetical protein
MSKAQFKIWCGLFVFFFLNAASTSRAQVAGPNGHFYQVVMESGLLWEEARARAADSTFNGVHGYLATITSADEDQFIENLRQQAAPGGYGSLWVGGSQVGSQPGDGLAPADGWYWVNGEGPIPAQPGAGYSNWQTGEPNDYSGPGSEMYLSVGHFNHFGWNDEPNDRHIMGYVVEYPSSGVANLVSVRTVDPIAIENIDVGVSGGAAVDSAMFLFMRTGDLSLDLPVFYSIHGTAMNGIDYNEIPRSIIIPSGKSEVRLEIVPKVDLLTLLEPMETVGLRLEPSQILSPVAAYYMDPENREAAAVIFERRPPPRMAIEIAVPRNGFVYQLAEPVTMIAALSSTQSISAVTSPVQFFADNQLIGTGTIDNIFNDLAFYKFTWTNPPAGTWTVAARVLLAIDNPPSSSPIKITIPGAVTPPQVSIRFVEPSTTEPWPDADYAPGYLEVGRQGSTDGNLQVFYSVGGTATAGVDYEALPGYVVIPAGKATAKIMVNAIDDTIDEPNETVVVRLLPPADNSPRYTIHPTAFAAQVVILDNDEPAGPPMVRIIATDPVAIEQQPEGGQVASPAVFQVTRTGDASQPSLLVRYSIHGTAKNGEDYDLITDNITIPVGKISAEIRIVPKSDTPSMGHKYEIVLEPNLTWQQARERARQKVYLNTIGHLATVTSREEDEKIEFLRQQSGGPVLWIGGFQEPTETSATDGWKWDNDEGPIPGTNGGAFYANWIAGEPNDYWGAGTENGMVIGWLNEFGWNDQGENIGAGGYVVEYDVDDPVPGSREPMETVGIRLEPMLTKPAFPIYVINENFRSDAAVILDGAGDTNGAVEVAIPSPGEIFRPNDVEFVVAGNHPIFDTTVVDYYVDDVKVGTSVMEFEHPISGGVLTHHFKWTSATSGNHVLQARANYQDGTVAVSSKIPFNVAGSANANPLAKITKPAEGAAFIEGDPIEVAAEAADSDGAIVLLELLMDGNVIAATNGPALHFTIKNASITSHTLIARATDNGGAIAESGAIHILMRHREAVAFVRRELPAGYSPGVSFLVSLRADPPAGTFAYAVEDKPPTGWHVTDVSDDGAFDSVTGKVKFGPFTDTAARTLTYRVTPPATAAGRYEFSGSSAVNGALYPITGDVDVQLVQQFHPADTNQDFKIPLAEVTAYAAAWKAGLSWPTGPAPIPLSYVTRAHYIWQHGEAYFFDPTAGAAPACWTPTSLGPRLLAAVTIAGAQRSVLGDLRSSAVAQVQIFTAPPGGSSGYAVEEKPPYGWTVSNISHEGTFDPITGLIRWGVFTDGTARTLSYTVTPPPAVTSVGVFAGQLSYDGKLIETSAQTGLENSVTINGVTPIRINNCSRTSAGVTLSISGPAGQTAVLEGSTDFTDWTEVKSIFIPGGAVQFTDDSAPAAARFYRLRVQ